MAKLLIPVGIGVGCASSFFLRNPTMLHKKKDLKFKCHHISHRGGAAENLENTMTAYKHAHSLGTDMLEIDCQRTKDGIVVVSHDNVLERTTGKCIKISETKYSDLPLMHSTLDVTFCKGKVISGEDRTIPRLSDVFDTFPKMVINIDIKIDNDHLIHEVSELVKMYKREEITIWGSFSDRVTTKCFKENPRLPLIISFRRALILLILYYMWLLPFVPIKESAYEMVMPRVFNDIGRKYFNSKPGRMFGSFLDYLIMDKKFIKHLNERGIFTALWVLNSEVDFKRAFDTGAQGVMTDYPTKLRAFLRENPQYENCN